MTRYSVEPRDWIFVKSYGFLSFARNMSKYRIRYLNSKYSKKLFDYAK